MSKNSHNLSTEENNIDKFDGSFDKEESGCTILVNETINNIKDFSALGIYTYLLCRPKTWKLNVKHLAALFTCSKDTIYKIIDKLIAMNLLSRSEVRDKGRFVRYHYRVHLRPIIIQPALDIQESVDLTCLKSPCPEIPDTVKPDAYKTKKVLNKDLILKPIVDLQSTAYKFDELFMIFYSIYPNKQKPELARKAFYKHKPDQVFVDFIVNDVLLRTKNNWFGRHKSKIPHPSTYLNAREWEGDIYPPEENRPSFTPKYKTFDQITGNDL